MDKAIDYVRKVFENKYYSKNQDIFIGEEQCTKDEMLICNCITGIMLNYAGYLSLICLKLTDCSLRFQLNNNIGYIQVKYKEKELIPDSNQESKTSEFYLGNLLCDKPNRKKEQSYIPFRAYSSRTYLGEQVSSIDIMKEIYEKNGRIYECYSFVFWLDFLSAMRMQSLQINSKAFLAMAMFMFPGRTIKCINAAIKNSSVQDKPNLQKLASFLSAYISFIESLEDKTEKNFFSQFVQGFKKLTNVFTGYLIEEIINKKDVLNAEKNLYQVLAGAYEKNRAECNRYRSELNYCIRILKEYDVWPDHLIAV